ncbi:MAG: class I SAM-dependent methyltransferase [Nocardioides sp.]|nr:class I SAM-dependent methyltransferase [Nocardioides sp.]
MIEQATEYILGAQPPELARLDAQSRHYAPATRDALLQAGLRPGMRVLDIGCGTGGVSLVAADIVGPTGEVVGVDAAPAPLEVARRAAEATGRYQARFEVGDLETWEPAEAYDALTGRLVAMYLPDAAAVLRRLSRSLVAGGIVVLQEFSMSSALQRPESPEFRVWNSWFIEAFRASGLPTDFGLELNDLLVRSGVVPEGAVAAAPVESGADATGYQLLAGIIRTLMPAIIAHGIATEEEIDIESFERRARETGADPRTTLMIPLLCSAWGRTPG